VFVIVPKSEVSKVTKLVGGKRAKRTPNAQVLSELQSALAILQSQHRRKFQGSLEVVIERIVLKSRDDGGAVQQWEINAIQVDSFEGKTWRVFGVNHTRRHRA